MREQLRRMVDDLARSAGRPLPGGLEPPTFEARQVYRSVVDYETGWPRASRLEQTTEGAGVKTVETTALERL